jgi:hypothetical protein
MNRVVYAITALITILVPAKLESKNSACLSQSALVARAPFDKYPARTATTSWRVPDVRRGDAHLYRTALRRASAGPPDFAGIYRLVWIGCGAGSACPAFLNRETGRVTFAPELRVVSWMPNDLAPDDRPAPERLTYRKDSRLLVVLGVRNENARTSGFTLYEWRGERLHLIRFVSQAQLCSRASDR